MNKINFMQNMAKNCKNWIFKKRKVDVPLFSAAARPPVKNKKAQHKMLSKIFEIFSENFSDEPS